MEEYVSNSLKARELSSKPVPEERVKVNKIVSGKKKKKNKFLTFVDLFIPEGIDNRKDFIVRGVMIPAFKKAVFDIFETMWYGDNAPSKKKKNGVRVSYGSYYKDEDKEERSTSSKRSGFSFDDVIVGSRGEAEEVFRAMEDIIERFKFVSVADLYDLVDLTCDYTGNKYGWTDISDAEAVRLRDGGYLLKMPKPYPLD